MASPATKVIESANNSIPILCLIMPS
jgi:hypothetical protein